MYVGMCLCLYFTEKTDEIIMKNKHHMKIVCKKVKKYESNIDGKYDQVDIKYLKD